MFRPSGISRTDSLMVILSLQNKVALTHLTFMDPHQVIEGLAETATSKKMEDLNNSEVFANSRVQVHVP